MHNAAMAANNIPLLCNICPKKPTFSDVSHLLTHIASKGHLANYYKIKVRASGEEGSRRLIEAYDRWYADWGVEELMSERMNQKDKRRGGARPRQTARPAPVPRADTSVPRATRRLAGGSLLDPRLSEQQLIKVEPMDDDTLMSMPGPVLRQRPYMPHMHYWATESRASSHSYTNPDYETSSEYSDPSDRRRQRYTIANSCAIEDEQPDAVGDTMAVSDSAKLKGVYWPGMDLFDSATAEMKRKRNQKKDSSVVEQLELNSQEVEPIECIFTPQGSFKRQRRISNSEWDDEDELEIKIESPVPVKPRRALATMDVNTRRPRQTNTSMFPFASNRQYEERSRSIFDNAIEDRQPKRKREFAVLRDDAMDEVTFSQPANLHYLTSAFSQQQTPTPLSGYVQFKSLSQPFQYDNKENVLPPFQHSYGDHTHTFHGIGHHHHNPFAYNAGQDQAGYPYNGHLFGDHLAYQSNQDDDDQRTITAPPSPSTS